MSRITLRGLSVVCNGILLGSTKLGTMVSILYGMSKLRLASEWKTNLRPNHILLCNVHCYLLGHQVYHCMNYYHC